MVEIIGSRAFEFPRFTDFIRHIGSILFSISITFKRNGDTQAEERRRHKNRPKRAKRGAKKDIEAGKKDKKDRK